MSLKDYLNRPDPKAPAGPKLAMVIHGVSTRSEEQFGKQVDALQKHVGPKIRLFPIFWGDLGVNIDQLAPLLPVPAIRSSSPTAWLLGGVWNLIAGYGVGSAITCADFVKYIGYAAAGDDKKAEQISAKMERETKDVVGKGYDWYWELFHFFRVPITKQLANFVGDVIVYQDEHHREQIHARILDKLSVINSAAREYGLRGNYGTAANPISIIAHSLGGVIAFDLAARRDCKIWVDHFFTMGSQPSFFFKIDPGRYQHLKRTASNKLVVPSEYR